MKIEQDSNETAIQLNRVNNWNRALIVFFTKFLSHLSICDVDVDCWLGYVFMSTGFGMGMIEQKQLNHIHQDMASWDPIKCIG